MSRVGVFASVDMINMIAETKSLRKGEFIVCQKKNKTSTGRNLENLELHHPPIALRCWLE